MISTYKIASIQRLLLKTAGYIGHSTHKYISRIFSNEFELSDIELEIIERILTMGFYSDDSIEIARFIALDTQIFNAVDFHILVCDVDNG